MSHVNTPNKPTGIPQKKMCTREHNVAIFYCQLKASNEQNEILREPSPVLVVSVYYLLNFLLIFAIAFAKAHKLSLFFKSLESAVSEFRRRVNEFENDFLCGCTRRLW
jgi:hypothetical protein